MLIKRFGAAVEVVLVLALFLAIRLALKNTGWGDWQESLFGRAALSSILLFFILPLTVVLLTRNTPGAVGLSIRRLGYHSRATLRAIMFVAPATILFPVVGFIGADPMEWPGASILAAGFVISGLFFALQSRDIENSTEALPGWSALPVYSILLMVGLALSFYLTPLSHLATRLVAIFFFVGFLEEFFFRGYVQSRLNDCFGRPFRFMGVSFGPGLVLAAVAFGLFHPITVAGDPPWAWGLWTAAMGLVFGYLREKTGAVIAPALLHGVIWIPGVLFGPG